MRAESAGKCADQVLLDPRAPVCMVMGPDARLSLTLVPSLTKLPSSARVWYDRAFGADCRLASVWLPVPQFAGNEQPVSALVTSVTSGQQWTLAIEPNARFVEIRVNASSGDTLRYTFYPEDQEHEFTVEPDVEVAPVPAAEEEQDAEAELHGDRRFETEWREANVDSLLERDKQTIKDLVSEAYTKYLNDCYNTLAFLRHDRLEFSDPILATEDILHFFRLLPVDADLQRGLLTSRVPAKLRNISLGEFMYLLLELASKCTGTGGLPVPLTPAIVKKFLKTVVRPRVDTLEEDPVRKELVRAPNLAEFARLRPAIRDLHFLLCSANLQPDSSMAADFVKLVETVQSEMEDRFGVTTVAVDKMRRRVHGLGLTSPATLTLWAFAEALVCLCVGGTARSLVENLEELIRKLKIAFFKQQARIAATETTIDQSTAN